MTNLTKHEQVWLQSYCASRNRVGYRYEECLLEADKLSKQFQDRFPPSPPPQKESEGVYVTKEMLAEAMKEVWIIGDWESGKRFNSVCKKLGLSDEQQNG